MKTLAMFGKSKTKEDVCYIWQEDCFGVQLFKGQDHIRPHFGVRLIGDTSHERKQDLIT